jgi:polyisoprenoid-binding protein YceI
MGNPQHLARELPVRAGVWQVEQENSEIGFAVKGLWGLLTVRGVFRIYEGTLNVLDGSADGQLTVDTASLDTGHPKRDQHLRSADFFDVERHPRMTFTTTAVAAHESGLILSGNLKIGTSQVELQIPVDVEPDAENRVLLRGGTSVSREAVGLRWNKLAAIRGDAKLHARLLLRRVERGGGR